MEVDLESAMIERCGLGVCPFGPLTRDESRIVDAYEAWCQERDEEYEAQVRAGGRTVCPSCGQRAVKTRAVCTYGVPGHGGSEYSELYECERCDYKKL